MKIPVSRHASPSISRRQLIQSAAIGACSLIPLPGLIHAAFAQPANVANVQSTDLGNNLILFSGTGCNVLVKNTDGSLLVIDGGLEVGSGDLLLAIDAATNSGRITRLINTHWHREQTGLNRGLGQQGVPIFAHENTRQWLSTAIHRPWEEQSFEPMPEVGRPTETFYHYGDLDHNGTTAEYGYLRQAHTDGDMYVYFPEENVLHGGGALANDGWPLIDWWTGGWIGGLANAFDVLLEIADDNTVIIPANGPVMNKAALQAMRDMYATLFERISAGFRAANSVDDTLADRPTAEFDTRFGDPEQFIRRAHESLIPHYTPDA